MDGRRFVCYVLSSLTALRLLRLVSKRYIRPLVGVVGVLNNLYYTIGGLSPPATS